jgi:hypothetical protein
LELVIVLEDMPHIKRYTTHKTLLQAHRVFEIPVTEIPDRIFIMR